MQTLPSPLTGIMCPMVTPLSDRDTLDAAGLERLIEHVLAGGVTSLFILGSTGEAPCLSYRLRRELIDRSCKLVAGRVPVVVGITDTAFVESVALAKHCADAGAAALVLAPPYYFPEGQPELVEYLQRLVPQLPLPTFLYNMPALTKVNWEPDTVKKALDLPGIIGMKDSSGSMIYYNRVREMTRGRPNWTMLIGSADLLAESVLLGGDGGVCGGSNVFPRLYVDLYNAAHARDFPRMMELHSRVLKVSGGMNNIGKYWSGTIKGLKCALSWLGVCGDYMAEPFHSFREPERLRVKQFLETFRQEKGGETYVKKLA